MIADAHAICGTDTVPSTDEEAHSWAKSTGTFMYIIASCERSVLYQVFEHFVMYSYRGLYVEQGDGSKTYVVATELTLVSERSYVME